MGDTRERYSSSDLRIMVDHVHRICSSTDAKMQALAAIPRGNLIWELLEKEQKQSRNPEKNSHSATGMLSKYQRWLADKMHTVSGVSAEKVLYIYQYYKRELSQIERREIEEYFPDYRIKYDCRMIVNFKRKDESDDDDDDDEEEEEEEEEKEKVKSKKERKSRDDEEKATRFAQKKRDKMRAKKEDDGEDEEMEEEEEEDETLLHVSRASSFCGRRSGMNLSPVMRTPGGTRRDIRDRDATPFIDRLVRHATLIHAYDPNEEVISEPWQRRVVPGAAAARQAAEAAAYSPPDFRSPARKRARQQKKKKKQPAAAAFAVPTAPAARSQRAAAATRASAPAAVLLQQMEEVMEELVKPGQAAVRKRGSAVAKEANLDESVIVTGEKSKTTRKAKSATGAAAAARTQQREGDEEMQSGEQVQQQQKQRSEYQRFLDKYAHLNDAFIDPSMRLESDSDEEEQPAATARAAATPAAAARAAAKPASAAPARRRPSSTAAASVAAPPHQSSAELQLLQQQVQQLQQQVQLLLQNQQAAARDGDEEQPAVRAAATPATAAATDAAKDTTPPSQTQSRPVRRVLLFRDDVAVDKESNAANPEAEKDDVAVTKNPEAANPTTGKDDVALTEQPKAAASTATSSSNDQAAETLQQVQLLLQDDNRNTEEVAMEMARLLGMPYVKPRVTDVVTKLREAKIEVKGEVNGEHQETQPAADGAADENLNALQMKPAEAEHVQSRIETAETMAGLLESFNIGDTIDRMVNDRVDKLLEMNDEIAEHIGVMSEEQMIEGVFDGIETAVNDVLNDDDFFEEIFNN